MLVAIFDPLIDELLGVALSLCTGIFEDVTSLSCDVLSDLGTLELRFSVFSDEYSLRVAKLPAYQQLAQAQNLPKVA